MRTSGLIVAMRDDPPAKAAAVVDLPGHTIQAVTGHVCSTHTPRHWEAELHLSLSFIGMSPPQ